MKISKVDITGFRAYAQKGDGIFDFTTTSGTPADFVAIYAPNGFGKSSFYDAIEWAMTNNIGRYIRDSLRTTNASTSLYLNSAEAGQSILRNRYIAEKDLSYVRVETTIRVFERFLRKAAIGKRDYRFDPNETSRETAHLSEVFLSQDAIDAFLKEERPEARYEKFMSEFGGHDETYRQKLYALRKACTQEIKKIQQQIKDLRASSTPEDFQEGLQFVNSTILQLSDTGIAFEKIDTSYNSSKDLGFKNSIATEKVELNKSIERDTILKSSIDGCLSSVSEFIRARGNRTRVRQRLEFLLSNKSQLEVRGATIAAIKEIAVRHREAVKASNLHKRLNDCLQSFLETKRSIQDIFSRRTVLQNEKQVNDVQAAITAQELEEITKITAETDTVLAGLRADVSAAPNLFLEIARAEAVTAETARQLVAIDKRLEVSIATKNAIESEIKRYSSLIIDRNSLYSSTVDALSDDKAFLASLHESVQIIDSLEGKIQEYKTEQARINIQSDSLQQMISLATELLAEEHSESCPLCRHQFASHEELTKRIFSHSGLTNLQQQVALRRESAEAELINYKEKLTKGFSALEIKKAERLTALQKEWNSIADELSDRELQRTTLKSELNQFGIKIAELKNITHDMSQEEYLVFLGELIQLESQKSAEHRARGSKIKADLDQSAKKGAQILQELVALNIRVTQLETEENYVSVKNYLDTHVVAEGAEASFFESRIEELVKSLITIERSIGEMESLVREQTEAITVMKGLFDSDILNTEIEKVGNALNQLEGLVTTYESKIKAIEMSIDLEKTEAELRSTLTQSSTIVQSRLSKQANQKKLIELLSLQLEKVLPFLKFLSDKESIEAAQTQLELHERLYINLNQEFASVEERLKIRIDNFFYTGLINNIYSKIDPHPTFKKVSFVCIFPENERPRLDVYLFEDGGRPISPNLYFSAAQLNILSLSIFLARALHVKHEGHFVETILIDDPIQSMDSINILSTIDLLRNISSRFNRQIILSTHDENFFELLKRKIPVSSHHSKFIKLESFGRVSRDG